MARRPPPWPRPPRPPRSRPGAGLAPVAAACAGPDRADRRGGGCGEPGQDDDSEPARADPLRPADQPDRHDQGDQVRDGGGHGSSRYTASRAAVAPGPAQHQQPQRQPADPGDQHRQGQRDVEDRIGRADLRMTRRVEALQLGELGEDQPEADQHGPGHERRGQAGPHPAWAVRAGAGRPDPGGHRTPGDAGSSGRAAAGVVEERTDLVSVPGPPGRRVERERGPGQQCRPGRGRAGRGRGPHAPAQPILVLSRSVATEATLLIRSDCCASASAPGDRYAVRPTAVVRLERLDQAAGLQSRDHRVEGARAEPYAHGLRHVLGDGVAVLGLSGQAGQHQQRRISPPVQPVCHVALPRRA